MTDYGDDIYIISGYERWQFHDDWESMHKNFTPKSCDNIPFKTKSLCILQDQIHLQSINRDIPWSNVPLSLSLGSGHAVTLGVGTPAGVTAALLPRPLLIQLSYLCVYSAYVLNHPLHHCSHIPRLNCVQPISCFYTFTQHLKHMNGWKICKSVLACTQCHAAILIHVVTCTILWL